MPRTARKSSESNILHVMFRGINREAIFRDEDDRLRFFQIMTKCKSICDFELMAWCLMDNHVHLLLRPRGEPMSLISKRIGCRYVYWYNQKYSRVGHLFQDRYRSEAVDTDAYFLTVLRYIMQNPLKAGMEQRMGDYRWTSFRAYAGHPDGLTDHEFASSYFQGKSEMLRFLTTVSDERAMDVPPDRASIPDSAVVKYLTEHDCVNAGQFSGFDRGTQIELMRELSQMGATLRQISEATGIPRSSVGRFTRAGTGDGSLSQE